MKKSILFLGAMMFVSVTGFANEERVATAVQCQMLNDDSMALATDSLEKSSELSLEASTLIKSKNLDFAGRIEFKKAIEAKAELRKKVQGRLDLLNALCPADASNAKEALSVVLQQIDVKANK